MDNNCLTDEEKQITQLNGLSVMKAFKNLKYSATASELSEQLVRWTGHPKKPVRDEVKRILDIGVNEGFLSRLKNNYTLPEVYQTDCDGEDDHAGAKRLLDKCIRELEEKYPTFDYEDYIKNHRFPYAISESGDETSRSSFADTDAESCASESSTRTDDEESASDEECDLDVTVIDKEEARRRAESPSASVDPFLYDVEERIRWRGDKEEARRIAESPSASVDPFVYDVEEKIRWRDSDSEADSTMTSCDDEEEPDVTVTVSRSRKRAFSDVGSCKSTCEPPEKKDCP